MAISASLVKQLRDKTGVGMMDCKRALEEAEGDIDKAIDVLRKSGIAKAEKRAERAAADGLVAAAITPGGESGSLVEVNCETDFVARNEEFRIFTKDLAALAVAKKPADVKELKATPFGDHASVADALVAFIAKIGENMVVRRCACYSVDGSGVVAAYVHHGEKVGVLVQVGCGKTESVGSDEFREAVRDVALQITAHNPSYIRPEEIPADVLEHERSIYREQFQGKPDNVIDKIVEGKLRKYYTEVCLLQQEFVKDRELSVAKYLDQRAKQLGDTIEIKRFTRFAVGETTE
jgi:elongation factor Ts